MKDVIFREEELVDREEEIKYFKKWFEKVPKEILWVYGPKSTGKTTLTEYIIENELFDDFKLFKSKKYNVKYINFRQKLFGSYDTFIKSMLSVDDIKRKEEVSSSINLGVFKIESKIYDEINNKRVDIFDELYNLFLKSDKRNIFIIDEIQALEDIYIDQEKELLREFLNFCVRLTKETHLAHVVILSSNTIFINRIYNDSKLKVTSEFYKISHLDYNTTKEWLQQKQFSDNEIDLIWEYLGGCIPLIQKLIRDYKNYNSLQDYLNYRTKFAKSEITMLFRENRLKNRKNLNPAFIEIAKGIIKDGYFDANFNTDTDIDMAVEFFSEKEIFFFEPIENIVYPNNQLYLKAMELLINQLKDRNV